MPDASNWPFSIPAPSKVASETLSSRLAWVIREWASHMQEKIFEFLEEQSDGKVTARDWALLFMGQTPATLEMVAVVAKHHPYFAEWIVLGKTSGKDQTSPN